MRRKKGVSVSVRAPSRGVVTRLPGESADMMAPRGGLVSGTLMNTAAYQRASAVGSNVRYEDGVVASAPGYQAVTLASDPPGVVITGAPSLLYQGNVIGQITPPVMLGTVGYLYSLSPSVNSGTFVLTHSVPLYSNVVANPTVGYSWSAESFFDKIIFAQRDCPCQYWSVKAPSYTGALPGLPVDDAQWDGVTMFFNHVLLWRDDRIKWSDVNDFSDWLPVASTAVSMTFTNTQDFTLPAPGQSVSVPIAQTQTSVQSVSISGDLTFSVLNGATQQKLINLVNTGNAAVAVNSITITAGSPNYLSNDFVGPVTIQPNTSYPVVVTFSPPAGSVQISVAGSLSLGVAATVIGTTVASISATGKPQLAALTIAGSASFGACISGTVLNSALVLFNSGTASMSVTALTLAQSTAVFRVGASPSVGTPIVIPAGGSYVLSTSFVPNGVGQQYTGQLSIVWTDASGNSTTTPVAFSGSTVVGALSNTAFVTDLGSCQFFNVAVGTVVNGTVYVTNIGNNSITLSGVTLPTGWTTSYSFGGGVVITPGSQTAVPVSYSPATLTNSTGAATPTFSSTSVGLSNQLTVSATVVSNVPNIALTGTLNFGQVPSGGYQYGYLAVQNNSTVPYTVTSVTLPSGFSTPTTTFTVAANGTGYVKVLFSPTAAVAYQGTLTLVSGSQAIGTTATTVSGVGFTNNTSEILQAGQYVFLQVPHLIDVPASVTPSYNYFQVVGATQTQVTLTLLNLTGVYTGASGPATIGAGTYFNTIDANEAGEAYTDGARTNGPIFQIIPQGDFAYVFKENCIQSLQYVGQGSGTFFLRNEVYGEGPIGRYAVCNREDGTMIFLGHKEMYAYTGGGNLTPICMQVSRQILNELDLAKAYSILMYHNKPRHEIWTKYPVLGGGFRVMVWNYIEDSATFDDYPSAPNFVSFCSIDWPTGLTWANISNLTTWANVTPASWTSTAGQVIRATAIVGADGSIQVHGLNYDRNGAAYYAVSESMDFDFGDRDVWKYIDAVALGLDVKIPLATGTLPTVTVQIGGAASFGAPITWSAPQTVAVDGSAPVPIKVNPGGVSGRFMRVRFSSNSVGAQWRISSFEILCRAGSTY